MVSPEQGLKIHAEPSPVRWRRGTTGCARFRTADAGSRSVEWCRLRLESQVPDRATRRQSGRKDEILFGTANRFSRLLRHETEQVCLARRIRPIVHQR